MPFINYLFLIPRRQKQAIFAAVDFVVLSLSVWLALVTRYGTFRPQYDFEDAVIVIFCSILSIVVFAVTGLYRAVVRYMGHQAIVTIIKAMVVSALILALSMLMVRSGMPRSTPFLYWGYALLLVGASRFIVRSIYSQLQNQRARRVAIYGAGDSGVQLLNAINLGGKYRAVAFIDDNTKLKNGVVNGVQVYHSDRLAELVDSKGIDEVLLALPSISKALRAEIINKLEPLPVRVKTVPRFEDLVLGSAKVEDVVDVDTEDLLGRTAVEPDRELLGHCIRGKVVMVTGAGGSIGSELCRQILLNRPKELVLFDLSEPSLYQIHRELGNKVKDWQDRVELRPILGTVQNRKHLRAVMEGFGVQTVYHAAAYKHVPLVEYNTAEGVRNNIFGTLSAGKAAIDAGVETFVLVSTDKAVRPTNVMGASKRMAELVLQAFSNKYDTSRFCMVRFGNVLGSSGSVVPLFREQIKSGGPITVTHKDITRYFMTIPEAAQLVLQASAMGKGGDVFVLDMGEPVKIVDLAKRMIHLMGCSVQKDDKPVEKGIEITYSGLRPGEKLYEELLVGDNVAGTQHGMIMRAEEEFLTEEQLDPLLQSLAHACDEQDCEEIQSILLSAVKGFDAKDGISDALWLRRSENGQLLEQKDTVITGNFPKVN